LYPVTVVIFGGVTLGATAEEAFVFGGAAWTGASSIPPKQTAKAKNGTSTRQRADLGIVMGRSPFHVHVNEKQTGVTVDWL
jgi:hypothetical protein